MPDITGKHCWPVYTFFLPYNFGEYLKNWLCATCLTDIYFAHSMTSWVHIGIHVQEHLQQGLDEMLAMLYIFIHLSLNDKCLFWSTLSEPSGYDMIWFMFPEISDGYGFSNMLWASNIDMVHSSELNWEPSLARNAKLSKMNALIWRPYRLTETISALTCYTVLCLKNSQCLIYSGVSVRASL